MSIRRFEKSISDQESIEDGLGEYQTENKRSESKSNHPTSPDRQRLLQQYEKRLADYKEIWDEIKKLERKNRGGFAEPELAKSIQFLDKERHSLHLEALSFGEELGKDKSEVMADILRNEGNLAEYGLSEFAVLRGDESLFSGEDLHRMQGKINIIYRIGDSTIGDGYERRPEVPRINRFIIEQRRQRLCQELGLEQNRFEDGFSHERNHIFYCVEVPNDQIERIAAVIRNNQDKFGIRSETFGGTEIGEATEKFKKDLRSFLNYIIIFGHGYIEAVVAYMKKNGSSEEVKITEEITAAILREDAERAERQGVVYEDDESKEE